MKPISVPRSFSSYPVYQTKGGPASEYKAEDSVPVQVMFTAGHSALVGGTKPTPQNQRNPFVTPVRGLPGSKGLRQSRISGRRGAMAIIRKYGILMKRQEFREKAEEIGFTKYR